MPQTGCSRSAARLAPRGPLPSPGAAGRPSSSGSLSSSLSRSPSVAACFSTSRGTRLPTSRRRALTIFVCRRESRLSRDPEGESNTKPVASSMTFHSRDLTIWATFPSASQGIAAPSTWPSCPSSLGRFAGLPLGDRGEHGSCRLLAGGSDASAHSEPAAGGSVMTRREMLLFLPPQRPAPPPPRAPGPLPDSLLSGGGGWQPWQTNSLVSELSTPFADQSWHLTHFLWLW
mmetsp:Transcript_20985/g.63099  ORF Transcript_20985/g.63099 Transcript_20985/m.63099 type:complete len:231 (-) Transcript_20985:1538-2230(-)